MTEERAESAGWTASYKHKKLAITIAILTWALAAFGAVEIVTKYRSHGHHAAKVAAKVSAGPVADVAGAAMAWGYNQSPGAKIERLLACQQKQNDYQCVAVVDSGGQKCAEIAFTMDGTGKTKLYQVAQLKNTVCGLS